MEFYISNSVQDVSGLLTIIGRCGDSPIRPGAEFHSILREKPRRYPQGLELPREFEKCSSIKIKVQDIEAYGKQVAFLPPNTIGILRCAESSIELIPGGWILSDQYVKTEPANGILPADRTATLPTSPTTPAQSST